MAKGYTAHCGKTRKSPAALTMNEPDRTACQTPEPLLPDEQPRRIVNSGSNERVRESQSDVAQYDQNVIRWDAAKTAYGYETKATTDVAEANLDKMAADQSEEAGFRGMMGSFISGAGNVAGKWMQGKSVGAFG